LFFLPLCGISHTSAHLPFRYGKVLLDCFLIGAQFEQKGKFLVAEKFALLPALL
jgi:hypothetical protein